MDQARKLVGRLDPDGQAARARRARANRRVQLCPGADATASLVAELPAEVASWCYTRVDALARKLRSRGDGRTLEQLRADVVADLLLGHDPGVAVPAAAATVFVHMPVDTALAISEHGCELAGYGPIPAAMAREIMTGPHATLRKVITDPVTGAPTDLGRTRRRPSALLRDLVAVRDRECATPGCHRPAHRSEIDHLGDWALGGPTSAGNNGAKCSLCHPLKDAPGWTIDHDPATGTCTITTPTGRHYTQPRHHINEPNESTSDIEAAVNDEPPF